MSSHTKTIVAMFAVAALAVGFWMLAIQPKRDRADQLQARIGSLKSSIAQSNQEAAAGIAARSKFSEDYEQLVLLGKAVPGGDDTPSLLVQLNGLARRAGIALDDVTLSSGGDGSTTASPPAPASSSGAPASPTEAAASLLPLGATIGSAGLGIMPYTLTFSGSFFGIADFIKGLDSLTKVKGSGVVADGRLITLNDFTLTAPGGDGSAGASSGSDGLQATLNVTTYLTPPDQGVTGGATPSAPSPSTSVPASTTTTGAP